jgi:McrBC 5-methylcytosine restriction system component
VIIWDRERTEVRVPVVAEHAERVARRVTRISAELAERKGFGILPKIEARADGGAVAMRSKHVIGWLGVSDTSATFAPRAFRARAEDEIPLILARYVAFSRSGRFTLDEERIDGERVEHGFIDVIASRFADELASALVDGVPRGYVEMPSTGPVLRGRISLRDLPLASIIAPHRIPQLVVERSADTLLGRTLAAAAQFLLGAVRSRSLRRRLRTLATAFDGIPPVAPPPVQLRNFRLPPSSAGFEMALRLARLVLDADALTSGSGGYEAPGMLFNSWHVFQEYCARLMQRVAERRGSGWRTVRGRRPYAIRDDGASIPCDPDVVLEYAGRPVLVLDVKDRTPAVPRAHEVYQVAAAARVCEVSVAVLLYPGSAAAQWYGLEGPGDPRHVVAISVDPAAVWSREQLIDEVERLDEALETASRRVPSAWTTPRRPV